MCVLPAINRTKVELKLPLESLSQTQLSYQSYQSGIEIPETIPTFCLPETINRTKVELK